MNSVAHIFEPRIILTQTRNRMEKKIYITPRGARQLREELAYLWRDKRPLVTEQGEQRPRWEIDPKMQSINTVNANYEK